MVSAAMLCMFNTIFNILCKNYVAVYDGISFISVDCKVISFYIYCTITLFHNLSQAVKSAILLCKRPHFLHYFYFLIKVHWTSFKTVPELLTDSKFTFKEI